MPRNNRTLKKTQNRIPWHRLFNDRFDTISKGNKSKNKQVGLCQTKAKKSINNLIRKHRLGKNLQIIYLTQD